MTPNTDTIPEAREAATRLNNDFRHMLPTLGDLDRYISEAINKHFQRRLSECGEMPELISKIRSKFKEFDGFNNMSPTLLELLQEHTACAVEEAQYAPGIWVCPKCGFENFRNILHVASGAISSDKTVADFACPNDGELMQRVTWKERCASIAKVCENQIERSVKAEGSVATLQKQCEELRQEVQRLKGAICTN